MTSFELITCLPSALSCTIMRDWLSLKSVVALDSAFCCRSFRIMFLDLVQSDEYCIREQVHIKGSSKILNVLHIYGEKLRSVEVHAWNFTPAKEERLLDYCHNLTHVRFQGYEACIFKLVRIVNDRTILVDLTNTYMEDFASLQIPLWRNLMSFGLGGTRLNSHSLSKLIKFCPRVVHLDLAFNRERTDADILLIVTHWKLRGFNIESCRNLTDASLVYIYTHCANTLHTLQVNCRSGDHEFADLTEDPFFSLAAISELLQHCTQLRTFHIQRFSRNDDYMYLPPIALRCITTLILKGTARVENVTASNKSSMMLQMLATSFHYPLNSLANLVCACSNLKVVYLNTYLTEEDTILKVNALKAIRPGIEISSMYSWEKCAKDFVMNM